MPRLPRVTAREVQRAIERDGWVSAGGKGGHRQFTHPTKRGRVTIPTHGGGAILPPGTIKSIIAQAGLTIDEFTGLL